ncbi:hypothetical protein Tco_0802531 [Tanacetum coccineum]|uniref:Uncharacterized protein n=1 Tax=Tanacetum coccineum TaxID=301880 RepID=A0ABQ4ZZ81_9ASTR
MSSSHQQALADACLDARPPVLEKGSYVPWASRFLRFLDRKKEKGILLRESIDNGPYKMKEIPDPTSPTDAPRNKEQTDIYASPSYSRSLQSYYVTHPSSVHDNDDDYQGEVNSGRITRNQGYNAGNGFIQKNVGNVKTV